MLNTILISLSWLLLTSSVLCYIFVTFLFWNVRYKNADDWAGYGIVFVFCASIAGLCSFYLIQFS